MYFNHAFKKVYVPATPGGILAIRTTGKTQDLTAGQLGLFDAQTYAAIAAAGSGNQPFLLVQGNYRTSDKIGKFHGGYQESIKSKTINPRYVSRFFKVTADTAQNQIIEVSGIEVECGKNYDLRLDIKGSAALKVLNHNLYKTLPAFSGCCADGCAAPCNGDPVDPAVVMLQWADAINNDPILAEFILAEVEVGGVAADSETYVPITDPVAIAALVVTMTLTVAYVDTKFGNCTFSVSDSYDLEPLFMYVSVVDESGNPCAVKNTVNSATGEGVTEIQAPRQASGSGETVLRDLILFNRYLQEPFSDGAVNALRMREIEGDQSMTIVDRNGLYDQVCILHNVPRFNNPSGVFDNDQYLLMIHVPTGTNTTTFTNLVSAILTAAGNTVPLEQF